MTTVLDLIKDSGFTPRFISRSSGGEHAGPCPWCGGEDRFRVWPLTNRYWCRQCGKSGNDISWLVDYKKIPFREAIKMLGKEKYFEKPFTSLKPVSRQTYKDEFNFFEPHTPAALWREKAGKFLTWAKENLKNNSQAISYLQGRGLSADSMVRFNIGVNDQEFYRDPAAWGIEREKKLYIPPGIVIPTYADGLLQRVRVRRFGEIKNRYYIVPGSSSEAMILCGSTSNGRSRSTDMPVIVVEAELDGMLIAQEAGDLVQVIASGSTAIRLTREQYVRVKSAPLVLLAFDYDEAGLLGCKWWSNQFRQAQRFPVPRGKDPGDAYRLGVNIREWVCSGLPYVRDSGLGFRGSGSTGLYDVEKQVQRGGEQDKDEGGRMKDEGPAFADAPPRQGAIDELYDLLKLSGATIVNEPGRIAIIHRENWEETHRLLSRRLSKLVFLNEDCCAYIDAHKDARVGWKNL